jgi:membrane protein involved in colicin uptake
MTTESTDQPGAPAQATEEAATATEDQKDWKAEFEKLQANSRKWEDRAKANAQASKELEQLRQQHESDQERAVREARDQARAEAMAEFGADRVADAFRVAAAGRDIDVDELLDDLKVEKFIGDDGTPNRDAVQQFIDRIKPAATEPGQPAPLDLGQGARGGQAPGLNSSQLERDLKAKLGIG